MRKISLRVKLTFSKLVYYPGMMWKYFSPVYNLHVLILLRGETSTRGNFQPTKTYGYIYKKPAAFPIYYIKLIILMCEITLIILDFTIIESLQQAQAKITAYLDG